MALAQWAKANHTRPCRKRSVYNHSFLSFGFFVYLFFHGILMEKVDDPGILGKLTLNL